MNTADPGSDDFEKVLPLRPTNKPLDARLIPVKPGAILLRMRALEIIDEYDGLLQRLMKIAGHCP